MKTTKPINLKYEDREWVYLMLRKGMRARKLHRTLAPIAEINPTFLPDYSHAVLAMLGFQNPAHDLHKLYNEMLDRYADNVAIDSLNNVVRDFYIELIEKLSEFPRTKLY